MYSIEESLKEQIKYCHELDRYRCGIYISHLGKKNFITDILKEILMQDDNVERMFCNKYETVVHFKNGSSIKVIPANECSRGYKYNGVIIDNEIENTIIECIIMPTLFPRWFEEGKREPWEEVKKRIFYCEL